MSLGMLINCQYCTLLDTRGHATSHDALGNEVREDGCGHCLSTFPSS